VNLTGIKAIVNYVYRPRWLITGSILISAPIAIIALSNFKPITTFPSFDLFSQQAKPDAQTCAMSGIYDSVEQVQDRLYEYERPAEIEAIAPEHRPSTWRKAIDFERPITTERKTLRKIPFVFASGGRLTTIHASKPQQVAKIIDRNQVVAGIDGAFFIMGRADSNQLVGPSLSRVDRKFNKGTAYEVMKSVGRPLVLMNADTVKFIPFDAKRHNTIEGMQNELPDVTDAFIAAGWLVQQGKPQTLASFGPLYNPNALRFRAFWGFDSEGKPTLGISTKNIGAVELGEILAEEGWQEAVMVDSGQSTSLAYQGKSLVPGYVPRPVPHVVGLLPPNPKSSIVNNCPN
jgi:poly-beta-1,6-N-acetyl-D-glucosamine N-deacetylase